VSSNGTEWIVEGSTSDDDWIVIFHEMKRRWPECVFERVDHGEAFIYKDQEALRVGLMDELPEDGMLQVLVSLESLTIVADEEPSETFEVGKGLYERLLRCRTKNRLLGVDTK